MEDHRTDHRTDRLGVLLDQLDRAREITQARLDGLASPASLPEGAPLPPRTGDGPLTDEEYLWEPAPGAWSIRRRAVVASALEMAHTRRPSWWVSTPTGEFDAVCQHAHCVDFLPGDDVDGIGRDRTHGRTVTDTPA